MIKKYKFEYEDTMISFDVDLDIFTTELAEATLTFFDWYYDNEGDPIDEVMKKYALKALELSAFYGLGKESLKEDFKHVEGFGSIDGKIGITLTYLDIFRFDEDNLEMKIYESLSNSPK